MPTPALRARSSSSGSSPSPGCGRELGGPVVAAQQLQRAVHLLHRLAAEVGDAVGRLAHALVARGGAERLGLDDDQRDVVGDDVVQLLRDPQALVGDRALALGDGAARRRPDVEPEPDADHAQEREPDRSPSVNCGPPATR